MKATAAYTKALALCCAFALSLIWPLASVAQQNALISERAIDSSVVDALPREVGTRLRIIAHLDLTRHFATSSQWTLVAAMQNDKPKDESSEEHGPVYLCLVKDTRPDCSQHLLPVVSTDVFGLNTPYHLLDDRVVYAGPGNSNPVLLVKVAGAFSGDSDRGIATAVYKYEKTSDRFVRVFLNLTYNNNNQATRFVESGPLEGDLIVDNPTEHPPYTYWLDVYQAGESGQYSRILRYRSLTQYADGNPLAVADSEMPEILRRLGLWTAGDPLPVPPRLPQHCKTLYMRHGEEWCK